jgi:hypothetical protein
MLIIFSWSFCFFVNKLVLQTNGERMRRKGQGKRSKGTEFGAGQHQANILLPHLNT